MTRAYGYDVVDEGAELGLVDVVAHSETWADMVRLQRDGVYPAAFAAITCPVLMLHGDIDPHPGRLTYDDLRRHTPQVEYVELEKCGHSPWLERTARDDFFERLTKWVAAQWRNGVAPRPEPSGGFESG